MKKVLEILARYHNKWLSMAISLGVPEHMREDIVQEMYIKIAGLKNPSKMLYKKDEPNTWYVYLTLQSVFIDVVRGERACHFIEEMEALTLTSKGMVDWDFEDKAM